MQPDVPPATPPGGGTGQADVPFCKKLVRRINWQGKKEATGSRKRAGNQLPIGQCSASPAACVKWGCVAYTAKLVHLFARTVYIKQHQSDVQYPSLQGEICRKPFCHLTGWYRAALERQAKPCYHTMEHQTLEWVDLYTRRVLPGNPISINYGPIKINNDAPSDEEIRLATSKLSNGRAAGASGMRAKHVKDWLWGVCQEEDAKGQGAPGGGDNWRLFAHLIKATWTYGINPRQLLWIIVVLIPKGGGDYCGIGLFEPIWKVIERVIDCRLDSIQLHDSLHGC
jgi:hypothetical protein